MKEPAKNLPDTNVIVRYLVKDSLDLYNRAEKFFKKVKTGEKKAVILESVVAECIYVLTKIYKVPKSEASGSLIDLLRYKGIANNDREELVEALTLFADHNLDIVDSILCVKARGANRFLFSFDRVLNKIAGIY